MERVEKNFQAEKDYQADRAIVAAAAATGEDCAAETARCYWLQASQFPR